MSDGVSDAYRASNSAEVFRKKWEKAQVEELLLTDLRRDLASLTTEELMYRAYQESEWLKVNHQTGWKIKYEWGDHFSTSIAESEESKHPQVKRYLVEVSGYFGSFHSYNLDEALTDAILYSRWLKTPEGKEAMEEYIND